MSVGAIHGARTGVVVIGRNEGDRLRACLASLKAHAGAGVAIVYADSGSNDGSPALARSMGAEVVELDVSARFTAARGRNAGLTRLLELRPATEFVQFIDGDCELKPGWVEAAEGAFENDEKAAVVCGRLREKHADASRYNRLCDMEWDRPPGVVDACGGISVMRASALRERGGFNEALAVGEEPELCLRLRREGWRVLRIPDEMATHDAAMTKFGQWWKRAVRTGQAAAETAWLHRKTEGVHNARRLLSPLVWAVALPVAAIALAAMTKGAGLAILLVYPAQWLRIRAAQRRRGRTGPESSLFATFTLIGKFAEVAGMLRAARALARGGTGGLIEYKTPAPPGVAKANSEAPTPPEYSEAAR